MLTISRKNTKTIERIAELLDRYTDMTNSIEEIPNQLRAMLEPRGWDPDDTEDTAINRARLDPEYEALTSGSYRAACEKVQANIVNELATFGILIE